MSLKKKPRFKDPDLIGVNEKFYHFRNLNSRSVSKKPFVLDCLNVSESQSLLKSKDYNGLGDKHL